MFFEKKRRYTETQFSHITQEKIQSEAVLALIQEFLAKAIQKISSIERRNLVIEEMHPNFIAKTGEVVTGYKLVAPVEAGIRRKNLIENIFMGNIPVAAELNLHILYMTEPYLTGIKLRPQEKIIGRQISIGAGLTVFDGINEVKTVLSFSMDDKDVTLPMIPVSTLKLDQQGQVISEEVDLEEVRQQLDGYLGRFVNTWRHQKDEVIRKVLEHNKVIAPEQAKRKRF